MTNQIKRSYHTNLKLNCTFGIPRKAYGEDDAETHQAIGDIGEVTGDEPVAFPDAAAGDDGPITPAPVVIPSVDADKPKAPEGDKAKDVTLEQDPGDEKMPDFEKKASESKKQDKAPTEAEKAASEAAANAEKAKKEGEDKAKESEKSKYDADEALKKVDELQVKPNASQKTKDDWAKLKEITKHSVEKVKEYEAKIKELESAPKVEVPTPTEEVEGLKKQITELEHYRATRELANDPKIQKEYVEATTAADDALFDYMVNSPALGLPKEHADKIRALGLDTAAGQDAIGALIGKLDGQAINPLVKLKLNRLLEARYDVTEKHQAKLSALEKEVGSIPERKKAEEAEESKKWSEEVGKHTFPATKGMDWAYKKEPKIDGTALTPEEIAHNERVDKVYVPKYSETVEALFSKDPATVAKAAVAVIQAEELSKAVAAKDAEIAELKKRAGELEELAKPVRRTAMRIASPPAEKEIVFGNGSGEMSADAAFEAYEQRKQ